MSAVLPNQKIDARARTTGNRHMQESLLEAATGVSPVIEVLQTSARGDGQCATMWEGAAQSKVLRHAPDRAFS